MSLCRSISKRIVALRSANVALDLRYFRGAKGDIPNGFKTNLLCIVLVFAFCASTFGQSPSDKIKRATQNLNSKQSFKLEYKMKKGQEIRWSVEHVASTKAQIAGEKEDTSSRTKSQKLWKVSSVDSVGNMTFVHSIESVDMWQQIGEGEPITYNSETDKTPPMEFESVTEKIGKPLAVISISPTGQVVDRKTSLQQARFGVGEITVPLPAKNIAIGHKWFVPSVLTAKDEDGRTQQLKTRLHYELSRVKLPNAYISFRTEVLTPIQSEKVKSQIMQQMTKGYVVFDIDRGMVAHKEIEWDEKVQGYEGPDSYLNYVGKMTEKLIAGSARPLAPTGTSSTTKKGGIVTTATEIKTRDGKPIMRK